MTAPAPGGGGVMHLNAYSNAGWNRRSTTCYIGRIRRCNAAYQQQRGLQLDVIDSRIISNMVAPIMQGKDPATTAGYAGIAVSRTEAAAISSTPETIAPTITRAAMREAAKAATENGKSE